MPNNGPYSDAGRDNGGPSVAATGVLINVDQSSSANNTSQDLVMKLMGPLAERAGKHLAEVLDHGLASTGAKNVDSHIEKVKEVSGISEPTFTPKKTEKLAEWVTEASEVNERESPELAAAWRAALADILSGNDYELLAIAKKLTKRDIQTMMRLHHGDELDFHDAGDRLVMLGIAKRVPFGGRPFRLWVLLTLTVSLVAVAPFLAESVEAARHVSVSLDSDTPIGSMIRAAKSLGLASGICYVLGSVYYLFANASRLSGYRLNYIGDEVYSKIRPYLPDELK